MKIEFLKPYTDEFGKNYFPGWVADMSQPDAERLIGAGVANPAKEGAYPRKSAAPVFECATPRSGQAQTLSKVADAVEEAVAKQQNQPLAVAKQQNQPLAGDILPTGETVTIAELTEKPAKKSFFK